MSLQQTILKKNANTIAKIYRNRFNENENNRLQEIWKVLCSEFFQKYLKNESRLLDIGCGTGTFINNIKAASKTGLDLNSESAKRVHTGIHFININALELNFEKHGKFDYVFLSNFLEHLTSKTELENLLERIYDVLSPSGKVLIMGPNIKYLTDAYWDFYDHHLPLSHLSLCEVLKIKGFSIELCVKKFLPYTTKGKLPTHPILVSIYLKIPILWRVFGKQFFVIAQKQ